MLTLVQYDQPEGATDYVNSMWEIQKEPFAGDVVNSYNDGPPAPGAKPLGPFYELETSSPGRSARARREPHARAPDVPRPGRRARSSTRWLSSFWASPSRRSRRLCPPDSRYFFSFSFPQSWLPEPCAFLQASRHRWMSTSPIFGLGLRASRDGKAGNGLCGSLWYQ